MEHHLLAELESLHLTDARYLFWCRILMKTYHLRHESNRTLRHLRRDVLKSAQEFIAEIRLHHGLKKQIHTLRLRVNLYEPQS